MKTLEVKNLCIKNGDFYIVKNLNLSVTQGEISALVGKSGSGKTLSSMTLLNQIPSNLSVSGEILLDGAKFNTKTNRILSYIMQNPQSAFNPLWSILSHAKETQNANFGAVDENEIYQTLELVGLKREVAKLYPFEMSGGMLQRAAIALSLLQKTPFLIADEATTSLDLIAQDVILEILQNLVVQKNIGILVITHDFGVVAKIAKNVFVIDNGEIVETGDVCEIFQNPTKEPTKQLLQAHFELYKD